MNQNGSVLALVAEMAWGAIDLAARHFAHAASLPPEAVAAVRQAVLCSLAGHGDCPIRVPPGLEIGRDGLSSALGFASWCGVWFLVPPAQATDGNPRALASPEGGA